MKWSVFLLAVAAASQCPGMDRWHNLSLGSRYAICLPHNNGTTFCADECVEAAKAVTNCTLEEFNNATEFGYNETQWKQHLVFFQSYAPMCECTNALGEALECNGVDLPFDQKNGTQVAQLTGDCKGCQRTNAKVTQCSAQVKDWKTSFGKIHLDAYVQKLDTATSALSTVCGPDGSNSTAANMTCAQAVTKWHSLTQEGKCVEKRVMSASTCADGCVESAIAMRACSFEEYQKTSSSFANYITILPLNGTMTAASWNREKTMFALFHTVCLCDSVVSAAAHCLSHSLDKSHNETRNETTEWTYADLVDDFVQADADDQEAGCKACPMTIGASRFCFSVLEYRTRRAFNYTAAEFSRKTNRAETGMIRGSAPCSGSDCQGKNQTLLPYIGSLQMVTQVFANECPWTAAPSSSGAFALSALLVAFVVSFA